MEHHVLIIKMSKKGSVVKVYETSLGLFLVLLEH